MTKRVYEVTAAGFDGGTDETDDRVLWIEAESEQQILDAITDCGSTYCGELPSGHGVAEGAIDFVLPQQTLNLSERLLHFVGLERNKNRLT